LTDAGDLPGENARIITYLAEVVAVGVPADPCLRNALADRRTRHAITTSHNKRYPFHKEVTGSEIPRYLPFKSILNCAGKRITGITPTPVLPRQ
jgi:hypothetical protein